MSKTKPAVETLTYEQAFEELEKIVTSLEGDQIALDDAMALFERGQVLAQRCATLLDQAELRVRVLTGEETRNGTVED